MVEQESSQSKDLRKVLIVDDESHVVEILQSRLLASGYQAIPAYSGEECLEKAKTEDPDLILLDIMMPGINGFLTLSRLKESKETQHIPVIILSAKQQVDDVRQAIDTGAIDYVRKPYEGRELVDKIRMVVD